MRDLSTIYDCRGFPLPETVRGFRQRPLNRGAREKFGSQSGRWDHTTGRMGEE